MTKTFSRALQILGLGGSIVCATSGWAVAASITQTFAYASGPGTEVSANYFDSGLGTLRSITLNTNSTVNGSYSITNTGSGVASGTAGVFEGLVVRPDLQSGHAGFMATNVLMPILFSISQYQNTVSFNLASGETRLQPVASGVVSGAQTDTAAGDLAALTMAGGGSFGFTPMAQEVFFEGNVMGSIALRSADSTVGSFSLTYNYTTPEAASAAAAPEPSQWALLLVGVGRSGMALRRRRRPAVRPLRTC